MKKQYPHVVAIRKNLIWIVVIALLGLTALIVYNVSSSTAPPPAKVATSSFTTDVASESDAAWFKQSTIKTAVQSSIPAPELMPKNFDDMDEKAMQAPIMSNQILVNRALSQTKQQDARSASGRQVSSPGNLTNTKTTDFNGQNEKKSFLKNNQNSTADDLKQSLQKPINPHEIKTGTIIPSILISGINSDLPGPIIAQVRENVYDTVSGRYILIPQGAKLQGLYDSSIAYGQKRVLIVWKRLIFPNGNSLNLSAMPGTDVSGYSGFKDQVNNHFVRLFGSALMMSLISAGTQLSQPQQQTNSNDSLSVNQILAQNLGITLSQTTDLLLRKNMNIQPTLNIRPGYLFNVSVTKDILLP